MTSLLRFYDCDLERENEEISFAVYKAARSVTVELFPCLFVWFVKRNGGSNVHSFSLLTLSMTLKLLRSGMDIVSRPFTVVSTHLMPHV